MYVILYNIFILVKIKSVKKIHDTFKKNIFNSIYLLIAAF